MRRILENYFKIYGGIDFDDICNEFEGEEKVICNSLFSWGHAGSHQAMDDFFITGDKSQTDKYLEVFKAIFDNEGHISHYRMMMNE